MRLPLPNKFTSTSRKKTARRCRLPIEKLLERANAVAGSLLLRGIQPRDTVAIMLPTCPEFFPTFFGILLAGAIPVPIYPPFRADRIEEYAARQSGILRNAEAKMLVMFQQAAGVARLLQPKVPSLREVVTAARLARRSGSFSLRERAGSAGARAGCELAPCPRRRSGAAAIHIGLDGRSKGSDVDAREFAGQHPIDQ